MIDFLHKFWIELLAVLHGDGIELFAVITGLLYVYLEIKQNKMMWIVGIISSLVFVYVYFTSKFYASMAESGYYVIISVYGYFRWTKIEKQAVMSSEAKRSRDIPLKRGDSSTALGMTVFIAIGIILSATLGLILKNFTDSPVPYFDGLKVAFGIVATWMLTQKIIQHWYFWMGINIFCVPLYASQGLYFTAFMFFVYFILSIIGLQQWKKDLKKTS
ncbi:MAG: nicotinamide riboside transporter PnuC [Bacteroidales bacterium]|nr:nicotinamide riboside transporter PnuC [Bacteroidales bacterium]